MHHGCNTAVLIRLAPKLGISVEYLRRAGEIRFSHPKVGRRPRTSVPERRKDASRDVTSFFAEVEALLRRSGDA